MSFTEFKLMKRALFEHGECWNSWIFHLSGMPIWRMCYWGRIDGRYQSLLAQTLGVWICIIDRQKPWQISRMCAQFQINMIFHLESMAYGIHTEYYQAIMNVCNGCRKKINFRWKFMHYSQFWFPVSFSSLDFSLDLGFFFCFA